MSAQHKTVLTMKIPLRPRAKLARMVAAQEQEKYSTLYCLTNCCTPNAPIYIFGDPSAEQ